MVNTRDFEHTNLTEISCHHMFALEGNVFNFEVGLVNPEKQVSTATRATLVDLMDLQDPNALDGVSSIARINEFEVCHSKDVVLIKHGTGFIAGQVWCHAAVSGQSSSVVSCWSLQTLNKEHRCALWLKADNPAVVNPNTIICSVIWESVGHNVVKTLLPTKLF